MGIEVALSQAALTNTATVDFTSTELSQAPVGVLALLGTGSANGTSADNANPSIGSTDGTRESGFAHLNESGRASVLVAREFYNTLVVERDPDAAQRDSVSHNSFLSDGWRADHTNRSNGGHLALAAMFGGSDVTAESGVVDLGTSSSQITVSLNNTSLTPNVIIFYSACNEVNEGGSFFVPSFGIAVDDGTTITQRQFSWSDDNASADGDPRTAISTSHIARQKTNGSSGFDWSVTFDSVSSGQFKITPDSSTGNDDLGFLALQIDNANLALVDVDTPTSTGINEQTGPGFTPKFVMQCMSMLTSLDSEASDASAGAWALSLFNANEEFCYSWAIEDAAATTNTQSLCHNRAVYYDADDGTLAFDGSFNAFTANGWEINYSTVDGTARKGFALAIGAAGGGGTTFTQSVSGSVTPAGALTRKTMVSFAGSITPIGRVFKKSFLDLAGSITATGALAARVVIQHAISGSITPAGALTRKIGKAVSGSVTAAGTLTRKISKQLAGSVTSVGSLVKKTAKALSGSTTGSGSLISGFRFTQNVSGSVTGSSNLNTAFTPGDPGESGISTPLFRTKNNDGTMKSLTETRVDLLNTIQGNPAHKDLGSLWHTFFDEKGIPAGSLNDRMVRWLKNTKGLSGKNINDLLNKWRGKL